MPTFDARSLNIIQLGIGLFFKCLADYASNNIQETVTTAYHNQTGAVDANAGYYALAITNGANALFNFFAIVVIGVMTAKWTLVISGCCYVISYLPYLNISNAFLYSTAAIGGVGYSLTWIGMSEYITKNSDQMTMGRNSAIVAGMIQAGAPVGGTLLLIQFRSSGTWSVKTIEMAYASFICIVSVSIVVFALLRQPLEQKNYAKSTHSRISFLKSLPDRSDASLVSEIPFNPKEKETVLLALGEKPNCWTYFTETFNLLKTVPMLLLSIAFVFQGLQFSFFSAIYGTCLSFTEAFGNWSKILLSLNLVFIGVGGIFGGCLCAILSTKISSRYPIVLIGMSALLVAYFLIFLNLPSRSPFENTSESTYIGPNIYLAMFCSFLLSFAEMCWNTQIFALLGTIYSKQCVSAFALYNFFQSVALCCSFFYSGYLSLGSQLVILATMCLVSTAAFSKVDSAAVALRLGYDTIPASEDMA